MTPLESALGDTVGSWTGSNLFRLMPDDAAHEGPATARVSLAAKGNLASVAYTWTHADDGPQDGLIVVGAVDHGESALAMWADSWHQHPAPQLCTGMLGDGLVEVEYDYADGWTWRIVVDANGGDSLRLRMLNVVPDSEAAQGAPPGPYDAMVLELTRQR